MASIYKRRNKSGEIVYYGAIRVNGELIRRKLGISMKSAKRQLELVSKLLKFMPTGLGRKNLRSGLLNFLRFFYKYYVNLCPTKSFVTIVKTIGNRLKIIMIRLIIIRF